MNNNKNNIKSQEKFKDSFVILQKSILYKLGSIKLKRSSMEIFSKMLSLDKKKDKFVATIKFLSEELYYNRRTIIRGIEELKNNNLISYVRTKIIVNTKIGNFTKYINEYNINYDILNNINYSKKINYVKEFELKEEELKEEEEIINNEKEEEEEKTLEEIKKGNYIYDRNSEETEYNIIKNDFSNKTLEEIKRQEEIEEEIDKDNDIDNIAEKANVYFNDYIKLKYNKINSTQEIINNFKFLKNFLIKLLKTNSLKTIKNNLTDYFKYIKAQINNKEDFTYKIYNIYDVERTYYLIMDKMDKNFTDKKKEELTQINIEKENNKKAIMEELFLYIPFFKKYSFEEIKDFIKLVKFDVVIRSYRKLVSFTDEEIDLYNDIIVNNKNDFQKRNKMLTFFNFY